MRKSTNKGERTISIIGIIGDTHCPGMRKGYVPFLQRTFDAWGVDKVVHIGDLVDWNSISYHEKHPSNSNAYREYKQAKKQVAKIAEAFPKVDWMIGNHDALTQRQATTAGIPLDCLKDYADLWEVDWTVHPRFYKLLLDDVLYCHGDTGPGGQHSAYKHAVNNFKSTVQGHHHANGGVKYYTNEKFRVFGMDVGCGVDYKLLQFEYGRKFPRKPVLGCGVVVNGKQAYFEPWVLPSR